ncbi:MAG: 16S rRNA (guanine(527)-N(7))-methyltransferase RsmG [Deltaproteobacteria bacterium]|jgi:16S rRNA (guanine527-N7)-methyltransferase|nr:16S rRNA (guanine(527)-N(7))-methyltransferase RsmG [Deltaproteobacteria bacterium]
MELLLEQCLNILLININKECITKLIKYWNFVIEYNNKVNLISRKTNLRDGFVNHIIDSLTPMMFEWPQSLKYLDIGSGGGFPGLPLKIANQGWDVALAEAKLKKTDFLSEAARRLGLTGLTVLQKHLGPGDGHGEFDLVTTRGFGDLGPSFPLAAAFLRKGGFFLPLKGPRGTEELDRARDAMARHGFGLSDSREFSLPVVGSRRVLFLFQRI